MKDTKQLPLLLACFLGLSGCTSIELPKDFSALRKINETLKHAMSSNKPAEQKNATVPESVHSELLPPLAMPMPKANVKQLEPRFDLAVNDVPANQVFLSIVSGTRYNMFVHPDVKGNVSVNLKDVSLKEALESLRDLYGYEYRMEGNRIYVNQPGLQTRIFKVNYIVGQRRGRSGLTVTAGAASSGRSGGGATGAVAATPTAGATSAMGAMGAMGAIGGAAAALGAGQASTVSSNQDIDFWREIESSVRAALTCGGSSGGPSSSSSVPQSASTSATGGAGVLSALTGAVGAPQNAGAGNPAAGGAATDSCSSRTVLINPMSGTVFVRAMPEELRTIDMLLKAMQDSVSRQVVLEAKIIDVELNSGAQQGINWATFRNGQHHSSVGANNSQITSSPGEGGKISGSQADLFGGGMIGLNNTAFGNGLGISLQINSFSSLLNFLQTQGSVNVLSSPRILTTNNQKAVLKVGKDEQYVTGFENTSGSTATGGGTVTNWPTPIYSTFFSGISLDVTPQIDDDGVITLHVHPLVSEVTEVMKQTLNREFLPFASNKISETDSVVKIGDGQIVVIGGLMTESSSDDDAHIPALGKLPVFGSLFRKLGRSQSKRELVIMLKPTIVRGNDTWMESLESVQQRIELMATQPVTRTVDAQQPVTKQTSEVE